MQYISAIPHHLHLLIYALTVEVLDLHLTSSLATRTAFFIFQFQLLEHTSNHREHTILLSRMTSNKGMKRMNSLL